MKKILLLILLITYMSLSQNIQVQEYKLKNGLKVLLSEDHSVPSICYYIYFHCGNKNERPGITGISHLFEHMMFNGSKKYKPGEFDIILEENGGYSNGSTWNDLTNYWEEFNPDILEKVLDMESDRMRNLKLDSENIEQERGIVMEERRMSVDNNPTEKMYEQLYAHAFIAHPYHFPVIGWMGDLENITLQDAKDYFKYYYAPNNATLILTGDFNTEQALKLIKKYFENIPQQTPPRKVVNSEPPQYGEKRLVMKDQVLTTSILYGYKASAYSDNDFCALDLLSDIMSSGKSSRMYMNLIDGKQLATEAYTAMDQTEHPGLFKVYSQLRSNVKTEDCEKEIENIIQNLKTNKITDQELEKVKNAKIREFLSNFKTNQRIGFILGYGEIMFGNYKSILSQIDNYKKVTVQDIQNVANKYLVENNRTTIIMSPKSN